MGSHCVQKSLCEESLCGSHCVTTAAAGLPWGKMQFPTEEIPLRQWGQRSVQTSVQHNIKTTENGV